jgi:enoyl-[acyl-carrier protein] reductase I
MRTLSSAGISGFDEIQKRVVQKSCVPRLAEPEELGRTGLYLLSDMSAGVTGETIHVDCGYNIVGI